MSSTTDELSWEEQINLFFGYSLTPVPNIEMSGNTTSEERTVRTDSNGEVKKTKITFRVEGSNRKTIFLQIFYPSSNLLNRLETCMYPGCTKEKHSSFASRVYTGKRYLCPVHVQKVKIHIQKLREQEATSSGCHEASDFNQFMSLCGLLHEASLQKETIQEITENESKTIMIQELFINVRNYLIIIYSLVDINDDLLAAFLSCIMDLVMIILVKAFRHQPFEHLSRLVNKIMEETLFFFGIIYPWKTIHVYTQNPYRQLDTGVGGGMVAGVLSVIINAGAAAMLNACKNAYYTERRNIERMEQTLCRYQDFRKIHKATPFPVIRACVVAFLVVVVAIQVAYIMS